MTSSLRTLFRLHPRTGQWTRSPLTALNLNRHAAPSPPPPSRFETLASETTPIPSIQAPIQDDARGAGNQITPPSPSPAPSLGGPDLASLPNRFFGVQVPKKPAPPAEGECCMSGCATCVYDLYLDDLEHFHAQARQARTEILDQLRRQRQHRQEEATTVLAEWPRAELGPPPTEAELWSTAGADRVVPFGQAEGGGEDPAAVAEREAAAARREISDPTLRAFLEMEARLKKQQQQRTSATVEAI
ncbi:hypothetical protein BMF94_6013 [Rhodotorula taiwanensis]|uniref:Oxidoreductase-like domain-containing protein n=1 Tax=Rhodotorula taiwanensis TaxID=741276 RepID=A0A2S5B2K5_9BASI|nr:hypothetical protein BMF94_6013 [Rhodotorula taiwanensis]